MISSTTSSIIQTYVLLIVEIFIKIKEHVWEIILFLISILLIHLDNLEFEAYFKLILSEIFSIIMPKNPLSANNIIDDTPVVDIATLIMTVDKTKPVFLARLPKSV